MFVLSLAGILVACIVVNGWGRNQETLEKILYVHTGYRVFSQVVGEEGVDF